MLSYSSMKEDHQHGFSYLCGSNLRVCPQYFRLQVSPSAWQVLIFTLSPCRHCLLQGSHRFLCFTCVHIISMLSASGFTCVHYHQHDLSIRFLSSALTITCVIRPGICLTSVVASFALYIVF